MSARRGAFLAIACLALAACGGSGDDTDRDRDGAFDAFRARTLREAESRQVGADQLDVIKSKDITFEEYQRAVGRSVTCMREAGIEVVGDVVTEDGGYSQINYSYAGSSAGRTDDETYDYAQACINTHSFFIEALYRSTPETLEAVDNAFEPYRSAVIQCLRENDSQVDEDASRSKITVAAVDLLTTSGIDCIRDSGFQQ